jgi:transposase-like protein
MKEGEKMNKDEYSPADKRVAALRMFIDGYSFGAIATKLGVDNQTLRKWYVEDEWEKVKEDTEREVKEKLVEVYEYAKANKLEVIEKLFKLEQLVFKDLIKLGIGLDRIIQATDGDLRMVQLKDIKKYSMLQDTMSKLLGTLGELRSKYLINEEDLNDVEEIEVILKAGGTTEVKKKTIADGD